MQSISVGSCLRLTIQHNRLSIEILRKQFAKAFHASVAKLENLHAVHALRQVDEILPLVARRHAHCPFHIFRAIFRRIALDELPDGRDSLEAGDAKVLPGRILSISVLVAETDGMTKR